MSGAVVQFAVIATTILVQAILVIVTCFASTWSECETPLFTMDWGLQEVDVALAATKQGFSVNYRNDLAVWMQNVGQVKELITATSAVMWLSVAALVLGIFATAIAGLVAFAPQKPDWNPWKVCLLFLLADASLRTAALLVYTLVVEAELENFNLGRMAKAMSENVPMMSISLFTRVFGTFATCRDKLHLQFGKSGTLGEVFMLFVVFLGIMMFGNHCPKTAADERAVLVRAPQQAPPPSTQMVPIRVDVVTTTMPVTTTVPVASYTTYPVALVPQ